MLRKQLWPAIGMTFVLCVITGLIYPGVVTALAQALFPREANGSLVTVNGRIVVASVATFRLSGRLITPVPHPNAGPAVYLPHELNEQGPDALRAGS